MIAATQAMRAERTVAPDRRDPWLIATVITLLSYGLIMVHSASIASGDQSLDTTMRISFQHAVHIALGIVVLVVTAMIPMQWWERMSKPLLLLGMLSLLLLLLPGAGVEVNGSRRWIPLGPLRLQPAEFAKLALVIYAASYLVRKREELRQFTQGILMIGIVLGIFAVLLLLQPDFGSFVVITLTVGLMLFLGGIRFWHFLMCGVVGGAAAVVLTITSPYRMERVMSFMDPWSDPFNSGFQLVQALIAFGRGDWSGVGLGASIQKLYYLPHANNDFLFAVIGEELGLLGVLFTIVLFGILLWRAFEIARRAERIGMIYPARLAQGIGLLIAIQSMINMGVNMGVLPTKGLTLPFISHGGSSMLASCIAVGLLFACDRASRPQPGARS